MEIKISKDALKTSVGIARKALSKVVIQEERGHLLFTVEENKMIVTGTNKDLKARCLVQIENVDSKNFSFTADPKIIEKLIAKIDHSDIRMDFDDSSHIVRIYTTESKKSFGSIQSFPVNKMLTFKEPAAFNNYVAVKKDVLDFSLKYAWNYMAPPKEEKKQYDFLVINNNIAFAGNGSNKMGFIIFKDFAGLKNFRIRKTIIPELKGIIANCKDIHLIETEKDFGIKCDETGILFTWLKSNVKAAEMPRQYLNSKRPFTVVRRDLLSKSLERLCSTSTSKLGAVIKVTLEGEKSDAHIDLSLVSELESVESIPCIREEEGSSKVEHILDHKLLKAVLSSFPTKDNIRLHINEDTKFLKVYHAGEIEGQKYTAIGIGAYARILKK